MSGRSQYRAECLSNRSSWQYARPISSAARTSSPCATRSSRGRSNALPPFCEIPFLAAAKKCLRAAASDSTDGQSPEAANAASSRLHSAKTGLRRSASRNALTASAGVTLSHSDSTHACNILRTARLGTRHQESLSRTAHATAGNAPGSKAVLHAT